MEKTITMIDGNEYAVGYPACAGCENLCFPAPLTCLFTGDGCEYPAQRIKAEANPIVEAQQENKVLDISGDSV